VPVTTTQYINRDVSNAFFRLVSARCDMQVTTAGSGSVVLGRSETGTESTPEKMHLGESKNISRTHAEIIWQAVSNKQNQFAWHLRCVGKNGLHINDKFLTNEDDPVALHTNDRIMISDVLVFFIHTDEHKACWPSMKRVSRGHTHKLSDDNVFHL